MYPKLITDLGKVKQNIDAIADLVKDRGGCSLMLVTKCICSDKRICELIEKHPRVDYMADSRLRNIKKYGDIIEDSEKPSVLLRIPMLEDAYKTVKYIDISQNSELSVMEALNEAAIKQNKVHKIILMIDLGDLREGIFYQNEDEILETAEKIHNMKGLELYGVSTNLTCYGAIIPKYDNLSILCGIAEKIEAKLGIKLTVISGGNSSSLYLIDKGQLPEKINNLRIGEGYLLGNETAYGEEIPGTCHDAFILEAQIVELKEKPSLPIGEVGMDAFGNVPEYEDRGIIKRAILGIGKQDTDVDGMIPLDEQIDVLGGSSDHMILDVTKCDKEYKVGDTVKFRLEYGALLKLETTEPEFIERVYIEA